tara:strand:- start:71 stop:286 length:216 start_codon:yes stop_codon:yes gene_type:complete
MKFRKLMQKYRFNKPEPTTYNIEELNMIDEITDEIEKSLWDIKDSLDIPTEEIDISVKNYKSNRKIRFKRE